MSIMGLSTMFCLVINGSSSLMLIGKPTLTVLYFGPIICSVIRFSRL